MCRYAHSDKHSNTQTKITLYTHKNLFDHTNKSTHSDGCAVDLDQGRLSKDRNPTIIRTHAHSIDPKFNISIWIHVYGQTMHAYKQKIESNSCRHDVSFRVFYALKCGLYSVLHISFTVRIVFR